MFTITITEAIIYALDLPTGPAIRHVQQEGGWIGVLTYSVAVRLTACSILNSHFAVWQTLVVGPGSQQLLYMPDLHGAI